MATYRAGFMHAEVDGYCSNYDKRSTVLLRSRLIKVKKKVKEVYSC